MAMMMEVEDDVFFADLNRQISLLITDDNEDGDEAYYSHQISSYYPTSVSIQGISRTSMFPTTQTHYHIDNFDHQMNYKTSSSTTTTNDHSKGTGVFIPKSSSSSQWNKSRRNKPTRNATNYNNYYNSYNNNNNNFRHHHHQQHQQQLLPSQSACTKVTIGSNKC